MRNYTTPFTATQISSSVNQALFASKGAPVRAERESPDAASTQEAPLGTNTEYSAKTDVNALLARLSGDLTNVQYRRVVRQLKFILQDIAKRVFEARTPPVFVEAFQKPTHYKTKDDYGRVAYKRSPKRPSLKHKPTHFEVETTWGFEYVKSEEKPRFVWDEELGFRKSFGFENATHVRLTHPYSRFGACMQLAAPVRPLFVEGDQMEREHWLKAQDEFREVSVCTKQHEDGSCRAEFKGFCRCGSPVLCTVCQTALLEGRSQEIDKGIYQWVKGGGYVIFVTWTVRHKVEHKLKHVLKVLRDGRDYARGNHRAWRDFSQEIGYQGSIRSLEWRWTTANGHHPHIHELMFLEEKPDPKKIKQFLFKRYAGRIQKKFGADYVPSFERGLRVDVCMTSDQFKNSVELEDGSLDLNSAQELSSYMSKTLDVSSSLEDFLASNQWSMGDEMAKGNAKRCEKKGYDGISYSYVSLLLHWQHCNDMLQKQLTDEERRNFTFVQQVCKDVLHEYAQWLKGVAVIHWSRGLKKTLGLDDLTDDELLEAYEESHDQHVCNLSVDQVRVMNLHKLKAKVLQLAEDLPPDKAKLAIYALIDVHRNKQRLITEYG